MKRFWPKITGLAIVMDWLAVEHGGRNDDEEAFIEDLQFLFTERAGRWPGGRGEGPMVNFGQSGFKPEYREEGPLFGRNNNQVRHFVGWLAAGYYWERAVATATLYDREHPYGGSRTRADWLLGIQGINLGISISYGWLGTDLEDAGDWVMEHLASK